MAFTTCDLFDADESLQSVSLQLANFGALPKFSGPIRTVRCYRDNGLVKSLLNSGAAETTLIFLGDIVDRGPASAAVIDRLRGLAHARPDRPDVRFLLGNHEEIFLGALDGEPKALRLFCRIGGRETVLSYGMEAAEYERLDYEELVKRLEILVPDEHRDFLRKFEDMIVIGDYAFVHAGVRPDTPSISSARRTCDGFAIPSSIIARRWKRRSSTATP